MFGETQSCDNRVYQAYDLLTRLDKKLVQARHKFCDEMLATPVQDGNKVLTDGAYYGILLIDQLVSQLDG